MTERGERMYSEKSRRRFRDKVRIDRESGCWIWIGRLLKGYGIFYAAGRKVYGHRYFFELVHGPVPAGRELDHGCGNKACVNPHHLEPVTHAENMRRAALRGVWSGEQNGNAKSTELVVVVIKRAYELGAPVKDLARIFNKPLRTVYAYIRGECWKHVER